MKAIIITAPGWESGHWFKIGTVVEITTDICASIYFYNALDINSPYNIEQVILTTDFELL